MRAARTSRHTSPHAAALAAVILLLGVAPSCADDEGATDLDGGADAGDVAEEAGDADVGPEGDAESDASDDASADPDASPAELRVATLNLRCLIDDWDVRLPILVAGLAELDPDLFGFQEACAEPGADNLADLVEALALETGRDYTVERTVTHRAWQRYDEGIAVVSALPIVDTDVVSLPGGVFTRKVVMTHVETALGTLVFATTHLDHQSADARAGQVEAVLVALDGFAGAGEPQVLTGDLNEGPAGGDVASTLAGAGFVDAWAEVGPAGEAGFTIPAGTPTDRIDYVWLEAGDSGLEARECEVILDQPVDGVYGSDHYGVTAVFRR